jgi:phasin
MSVMTTATRTYATKQADTPQIMREAAEKNTAQVKENIEKFNAASGEAAEAVRSAYLSAMNGAQNYSAKVIEFAQTNSDATFNFAKELPRVKSPSEFIELSAEHTRLQFEILTRQARELTELAQKVTEECAAPLRAGINKAFNMAA